jgi:hypothetical protein
MWNERRKERGREREEKGDGNKECMCIGERKGKRIKGRERG